MAGRDSFWLSGGGRRSDSGRGSVTGVSHGRVSDRIIHAACDEANPKTDKVCVMITNNSRGKADQTDAANPQPENQFGHIIEMLPDGRDHAAPGFRWEIPVRCGDPAISAVGATFTPATAKDGWFGMWDNCASAPTGGCGSRPTATPPRAPAAPSASGQRRRKGRRAEPRSSSSACQTGRRCASRS